MSVWIAAGLGAMTWTLLEYVIHRWGGHDRRFSRRSMFGREHTRHHSEGNYFAPTWKKAVMATVVVPLVAAPVALLTGPVLALAYALGLVGLYLVYEWIHRRLHVSAGWGPYARWARRHHFFHHFHDPSVNHGVTSPVWDWVFGTLRRPDQVAVPERLAMSWLCDEQGLVREEHRRDYVLRKSKRSARGPGRARLAVGARG